MTSNTSSTERLFHESRSLVLISTSTLSQKINACVRRFIKYTSTEDDFEMYLDMNCIEIIRFLMDSVLYMRKDTWKMDPRYKTLRNVLVDIINIDIMVATMIVKKLRIIVMNLLNTYYIDEVLIESNPHGWCFTKNNKVIKIWEYYESDNVSPRQKSDYTY